MRELKELTELLDENPHIDAETVKRSASLARQLSELGLTKGSYRLEPALGGVILQGTRSHSAAGQGGLQRLRGPE